MAGSKPEVQAADMRAPSGASVPTLVFEITGTGSTEANNTTGLTVGEMATLINGAVAIRVSFAAATGLSTQVGAANLIIGPYARFDWLVTLRDAFVYAEAVDGASVYEAYVWTSSGFRATS